MRGRGREAVGENSDIDQSEILTRTGQESMNQDNEDHIPEDRMEEDQIPEHRMEEEGLNTHRIEREPVQFSNKTIKILKQG